MLQVEPNAETTDSRWKLLYTAAGAPALISAIFIPIQVLVFIAWPPPLEGTAGDWFALFQENRLVGLLDLDLLLVADMVLLVPILLAFYPLLRRASESLMAIATALGLLGIVFFIATNPAIAMLSLNDRYAVATTEAERSIVLAAGEAMLSFWRGSAFHLAYILGSTAGVAIWSGCCKAPYSAS
jgi:hypothetical protein